MALQSPMPADDEEIVLDFGPGSGVRDPHTFLRALRDEAPVHEGAVVLDEFLGDTLGGMLTGAREQGMFTLLGFAECELALRDAKTFSSTGYAETIGLVMGHTILAMDGDEHRAQRSLVAEAFRAGTLSQWEDRFVRPLVRDLVDAIAPHGRADLVRALTVEFPVQVIARILGLPSDDYHAFRQWSIELINVAGDPEKGLLASAALRDYFARIVAERRARPRDDLISDLVRAEVEGEGLADEAIYSFLRLLLPAGAETTFRSSGNLLYLLLTNPDQLAAVRDDLSLVSHAIEEGLRFEPPLCSIVRSALVDIELGGMRIPAGSAVWVHFGSANRDARRWDRPDEFDVFREPKPHLSFATGPHLCLGMHLARLETKVALETVLERLPNLRLDPDRADDTYIHGVIFRSPNRLPVRFDT